VSECGAVGDRVHIPVSATVRRVRGGTPSLKKGEEVSSTKVLARKSGNTVGVRDARRSPCGVCNVLLEAYGAR